jgi:hypothetical protein
VAIGSGDPIGETHGRAKLNEYGLIDREWYDTYMKKFRENVEKNGILFDYAKTYYVPGVIPRWQRKR